MFLLWGLAQSLAHPFEANLYGFSTEVRIFEGHLDIRFEVEIPYKAVQKDLTSLLREKRDRTMEEIKYDFLKSRSEELNRAISVEIDQALQPCVLTDYSDQKLRQEGNFLVFFVTCRVNIDAGAHQISILHQYQEDAPSIFRNGLWLQRGIWLDETSLTAHMVWKKETENREIRLSLRTLPMLFMRLEQRWADMIGLEPHMSLREYHKKPSLFLRLKRRQLSLYEAGLYLAILLGAGIWRTSKEVKRDIVLMCVLIVMANVLSSEFLDDRLLWGSGIAVLGLLARRFFAVIFWVGLLVLPWWVPLPFIVPYFWDIRKQREM